MLPPCPSAWQSLSLGRSDPPTELVQECRDGHNLACVRSAEERAGRVGCWRVLVVRWLLQDVRLVEWSHGVLEMSSVGRPVLCGADGWHNAQERVLRM